MNKNNVQYRYALNEKNELIEVHDAHTQGGVYHCPQCGKKMIYKCGSQKAWHFAHDKAECDYNKYLHTIAEKRVLEWFNTANEIQIVLRANEVCEEKSNCHFYNEDICCRSIDTKVFNLKDYYTFCEKEKSYIKNGQKFVADLLCLPKNDKNEPLFIEICVTHPCDENKLKSGIKIIEFVVNSEEDIENLIGKQIRISNRVRLHNFHPKDQLSPPDSFYRLLQKFILYPSKKGFVRTVRCIEKNNRRGDIEITIPANDNNPAFLAFGGFYHTGFLIAIQYDKSLKHCCLCKNHDYDNVVGYGKCNYYMTYDNNGNLSKHDAMQCPYFCLNMDFAQLIQDEFYEYGKRNGFDIWINKERIDLF